MVYKSSFHLRLVLIYAVILLASCGADRPETGFAAALPAPAVQPAPPIAAGGIFQASQGYAGLYEGTRARRVGDALTILLVENITANKSASGNTSRSGSASITPPTAGLLSFLNPNALNAAANGSFNGKGSAAQNSTLNGVVSVTIAEVRPNGTARIVGEKHMSLSQGKEWVQFSGIIRLADIDADNQLPSTRVADAQINYAGKGSVQQASRPGWLSKFFSSISPF